MSDPASAADSSPASTVPHGRIEPASGWAALNLREVWTYRDVLWMLAVRDVKLRYKQTALGIDGLEGAGQRRGTD